MVKKTTKKTATKKTIKKIKIESPPSILELTEIAAAIAKVKVPENMVKQRDKLADAATKLSKRIFNGLGSEEKKAEREANKKAKAEAKAKRETARTEKKKAKIKKLQEQLAALTAEPESN